ncbi:hypothetical protein VUR80DRAFT_9813 [Thermomyces stellatus]
MRTVAMVRKEHVSIRSNSAMNKHISCVQCSWLCVRRYVLKHMGSTPVSTGGQPRVEGCQMQRGEARACQLAPSAILLPFQGAEPPISRPLRLSNSKGQIQRQYKTSPSRTGLPANTLKAALSPPCRDSHEKMPTRRQYRRPRITTPEKCVDH